MMSKGFLLQSTFYKNTYKISKRAAYLHQPIDRMLATLTELKKFPTNGAFELKFVFIFQKCAALFYSCYGSSSFIIKILKYIT